MSVARVSASKGGSHLPDVDRTLGHMDPWLVSILKILQFPAFIVDAVGQTISHYQNHLKMIPRHSQGSGTVFALQDS